MGLASVIIDAIARIIVPIVIAFIGRRVVKNITDTRLENIEKQMREHIRGYGDEDAAIMEKTIKEIFSKTFYAVLDKVKKIYNNFQNTESKGEITWK